MDFLIKILSILSAEMIEPHSYGWFHLLFVAIITGLTVFLCIKFKDSDDKTFRRIVLICWIVMASFEIYKQFVYNYNIENGVLSWGYRWESFPYQLCSTPLYVLPFIAFMKDNKFREYLTAYIATFSFFGGLATFCYPEDVFIETIGINIQTMIHHGLQIALGIFFIVYFRKRFNFKYYLKSLPIFGALVSLALIINEIFVAIMGSGENFNLFYISRHRNCTLPLLNIIDEALPYPLFLPLYILGFMLVALIIFSVAKGIILLVNKSKAIKHHA